MGKIGTRGYLIWLSGQIVKEFLILPFLQAQEMADVLIDHLNKQPQGMDHRHREMIEWLEKRDFYDYEVIVAR